jgi:hypothetical protein
VAQYLNLPSLRFAMVWKERGGSRDWKKSKAGVGGEINMDETTRSRSVKSMVVPFP